MKVQKTTVNKWGKVILVVGALVALYFLLKPKSSGATATAATVSQGQNTGGGGSSRLLSLVSPASIFPNAGGIGGMITPGVVSELYPEDVALLQSSSDAYDLWVQMGGAPDYLTFTGMPLDQMPEAVARIVREGRIAAAVSQYTNPSAPAWAQTTTTEQALQKIAEGNAASFNRPATTDPTYSYWLKIVQERAAAGNINYQKLLEGYTYNPYLGTWTAPES